MSGQGSKLDRRTLLRAAIMIAAAGAVNPIGLLRAQTNKLRRTADQILGPFYPVEGKFEHIDDLTHLPGKEGRAKGQLLEVSEWPRAHDRWRASGRRASGDMAGERSRAVRAPG